MFVSALRSAAVTIAVLSLAWLPCDSQTAGTAFTSAPLTMNQVVDRALARERALMHMLKTRTPLIETYLQDVRFDREAGPVPVRDHYFLGRMDFGETVDRRDYLPRKGGFQRILLGGFTKLYTIRYNPLGFSWMIFADVNDFNRETYQFKFSHRQFLGDVRCLVFDVIPRKGTGNSRFRGRIWVEDQDYNIVRLNGHYEPQPRNAYFFHMDSWRLNLVPGYWVPTYVYSEEGDSTDSSKDGIAFKAQTRLWGYDLQAHANDGEFAEILVDPMDSMVKDRSPVAQDLSPLEAQRQWMQQAADNVSDRLQNAGLLAPRGAIDKALETVVNNLMITNNLDLQTPVHVRVMLTSPLETFSVGHTMVVSRGLVDVLPNEASVAAVLAHELAHIVLGHNQGSKYAFSDRLLFSDESTYRNLGFRHTPGEEAAADEKAIQLLRNSPYDRNLAAAGLFLRQVAELGPALAALCTPHLGNGFADSKGRVTRMVALMNSAPALDRNKLDQISALPLGGRVKLNAWDDQAELIQTKPTVITSARDKMALEVTPFSPHLTRYDATVNPTTASAAKTGNE